jgi:hypothetical protein
MMSNTLPSLISINHDDYHARHIGRTSDGRQFFLTTPFVPATSSPGREFIAIYFFDDDGRLLDAKIDDLGTREALDLDRAKDLYERRLDELGSVEVGGIKVQPFEVQRFGVTFGLISRSPEEDDDVWCVEVQPGNYMAFFEPWDSGEYDT